MARLFYSYDMDYFYTEKDIRESYDTMTTDDKNEYDNNFEYYLSACLAINDGILTPLDEYIKTLEHAVNGRMVNEFNIDEHLNDVHALEKAYSFRRNNGGINK